jgi:hypothetical protein
MYGWLHRTAVSKNTPFIVDTAKFPPNYVAMEAPPTAAGEGGSAAALVSYGYGGDSTALKVGRCRLTI